MEKTELKKCPCCGLKPETVKSDSGFEIRCPKGEYQVSSATSEDAEKIWNESRFHEIKNR